MSLIYKKVVRTSRPNYYVPIDQDNPITKDLVLVDFPIEVNSPDPDNSGKLIDWLGEHHGDVSGVPTIQQTTRGPGVLLDGSSDSYSIPDHDDLNFGANDDCTIIALVRSDTDDQSAEFLEKQSGNPLYQIIYQNAAGFSSKIWFQVRDIGGTLISAESTTSYADGVTQQVACRRKAGVTLSIAIDGVEEHSIPDTTGSWINSTSLLVGTGNSGNFSGWIGYLLIFRRYLSITEVRSILVNPNQVLEKETQILPFPITGVTGALLAAAQSDSTFGAVATASASLTAGASAGDTPGGAAAAIADFTAGSTAAELQAAIATAQAAITAGSIADEAWTADAAAVASILAAALSGDTWAGAITGPGVQTGAFTAGSTTQATFLGAVQAIASIAAGATSQAVFLGAARKVGALIAAVQATESMVGITGAVAALSADALSDESITAVATVAGTLTAGASAGAMFDIAGEIGNLVATIVVRAALSAQVTVSKAIDGTITIN